MQAGTRGTESLVRSAKVLIVDDEYYTRKVIRTLLLATGITDVHDAIDGRAGLDAICSISPDVVILDWEMPLLSGAELVRIVRSPGVFPMPDVPIVMLSGHCERWRRSGATRWRRRRRIGSLFCCGPRRGGAITIRTALSRAAATSRRRRSAISWRVRQTRRRRLAPRWANTA